MIEIGKWYRIVGSTGYVMPIDNIKGNIGLATVFEFHRLTSGSMISVAHYGRHMFQSEVKDRNTLAEIWDAIAENKASTKNMIKVLFNL
jgi:hypothetical protein